MTDTSKLRIHLAVLLILMGVSLGFSEGGPSTKSTNLDVLQCSDGCYSCQGSGGIPYCLGCVNSLFDGYNQACVQSVELDATSCLVFGVDSECKYCKPGFTLYHGDEGQGILTACIKMQNTPSGAILSALTTFASAKIQISVC